MLDLCAGTILEISLVFISLLESRRSGEIGYLFWKLFNTFRYEQNVPANLDVKSFNTTFLVAENRDSLRSETTHIVTLV
jgi:hypothetical protein